MKKRILVTGGLGYIGSHTVIYLDKHDYEIVIVDNLSNSDMNMLELIQHRCLNQIEFRKGDIRDTDFLVSVFTEFKIDAVIHLAALKSITESMEQPDLYFDVNFNGSQNLINVMKQFDCRKLVFASSAAVYSTDNELPINEISKIELTNMYAKSKLDVEKLLREKHFDGLSVVILRYFNVIGFESTEMLQQIVKRPSNVEQLLLSSIINNQQFIVNKIGDDYPTRDYVDIHDVVNANLLSLKQVEMNESHYVVYNICTNVETSIDQFVDLYCQSKISYRQIDNEILRSRSSYKLARRFLNWQPNVSFNQSVNYTLNELRKEFKIEILH